MSNNNPQNKRGRSQISKGNDSKAVKKSNYSRSYHNSVDEKKNYHLILIFIVICIIPLIVRLKVYNTHMEQFTWFISEPYFCDLFLYYKQWTFIVIAAIMALIIAVKIYNERKSIQFLPIFIPLGIYAVLALLSATLSKYSSFSFTGSYEQFESVFALLGYCVLTYYAFLYVRTERDLTSVVYFILVAAVIMSILGLLQYTGNDFYVSDAGLELIIPEKYRTADMLTSNFAVNRVSLSLYNPNYVGVYVVLLVPSLVSAIMFKTNIKIKIISVLAVVGLVICLVGAQSLAGLIGLGVAFICFIIFMWRNLIKRLYITIPLILIVIIGFMILNYSTDQLFTKKIVDAIQNSKTNRNLTDMETNDDSISLVYKGNKMNVIVGMNADQSMSLLTYDDNNMIISGAYDITPGLYTITDERFKGIAMGMYEDGSFLIQVDGNNYNFTISSEDGTYYYINEYNRLDKLASAPSAIFTEYEPLASKRGYIWSRTIPLIKDYIILGSGPDTFTMVFPQNDYMNLKENGYGGFLHTKPHSLYLQIAVQTGVLSLIAFLTFYIIYFISSIRLYIKGCFNSNYAKVGLAVFISTLSYMVTGLVNDSSITTAPIFWALMGIGIAVNREAKPIILKELEMLKTDRISDGDEELHIIEKSKFKRK